MLHRLLILLGILAAAALWAGFGWHVFGQRHVIPYDPPVRCLHVALPIAPGHVMTQTFAGRAPGLSGVALAFRTTAAAAVAVELHAHDAQGAATPLAAATLPLPANHPFYTVHVVFPSQAESDGKTYSVRLRRPADTGADAANLGAAPLAWSCWSDGFAHGELYVDGDPAHGDLYFQPLYGRGAADAARAVTDRFQGIRVGIVPAWFWWLGLIVVLLVIPSLAVRAAGGRLGSPPHIVALLVVLPLVGLAMSWGDPRLHRPAVHANAAAPPRAASSAPAAPQLLHALRQQAVGSIAPQETWDRQLTFALEPATAADGTPRLVLRASVNTTVAWRDVTIPANALLTVRADGDLGRWTPDDGPIAVGMTVAVDGQELVTEREILITAAGEAREFIRQLDLAAYAGRALDLTLTTQGDTRNSARLVVWSDLRLR